MSTRVQSSIGESNYHGPQGRKLVIDDESLGGKRGKNIPPQAREISPSVAASLRQQAIEQQEGTDNRSLLDAKRRVEIITGLGRKTKDVNIETPEGNIIFTLRTLKSCEQNALAQVVENQPSVRLSDGKVSFTPTGMYQIKIEALGHSLFLIDGKSADIVLGTSQLDYDDRFEARKELVSEMDGALVDHLFIKYEELSRETYDGYSPKNEEEVKEVVDTIRKSGEDA